MTEETTTGVHRLYEVTSLGHLFDSGEWLKGAEKNASGVAFGLAGDVQAVVIAVDEVDIGMARGAEKDGVA